MTRQRSHVQGDDPMFRVVLTYTDEDGSVIERRYKGPYASRAAARGIATSEASHGARMRERWDRIRDADSKPLPRVRTRVEVATPVWQPLS